MNLKLLFFPPEIEKHFLPMLEHVYHNNNKYSTEKNQRSSLAILDLSCLKSFIFNGKFFETSVDSKPRNKGTFLKSF